MLIPSLPHCILFYAIIALFAAIGAADESDLSVDEIAIIQRAQQQRIEAIEKVVGSVIAIYGDEKQGGGSGVIIDPSGIGLTNHHVIMGAGVQGWGGLADGKMYRWKLIGTDPGGDVSIIQMEGRDDFPYTPLGDSDSVQVGDWSLAMGNPFILTEDQKPTVTLGIVSGIKRYQPGAGKNQLVYGNCIQTDSSINPGNSGGPLFNFNGEVVGINGRGSFKERGRVNVGLGYAISSNQIKNFIPELLATKLVEHGTLDANFEDRDGKVLCSNVYEDSDLYKQGVRPGDELLEFERTPIETANQFTNLICTLPEDWPAVLTIRKRDAKQTTIYTRLYGLPYSKPKKRPERPRDREPSPEEREQQRRTEDMIKLLSAKPGTVRYDDINTTYANKIVAGWVGKSAGIAEDDKPLQAWTIEYEDENPGGDALKFVVVGNGKFRVDIGDQSHMGHGDKFKQLSNVESGESKTMSLVEAKLCPGTVQAIAILAANGIGMFDAFGQPLIDGSDRCGKTATVRMKLNDAEDDPFFLWFGLAHVHSNSEIELIKAGADWNCNQSPGGTRFENWQEQAGLRIPAKLKLVRHLNETVQQSFKLANVSVDNFDEDKFLEAWGKDDQDATVEQPNDE